MTTYMTRAPLQPIVNSHMMSDPHDNGRRTSKRLEQREDATLVNGFGHENKAVGGARNDTAKQGKGKITGVNTKSAAKRKPAYDEEVNGFPFTRTRAKKAKPEPVLPATNEEDKPEERVEPEPPRKSRRKSSSPPNAVTGESEQRDGKRRSARHSGEHEKTDLPPLPVKKRRKDRSSSEMKTDQVIEPPKETPNDQTTQPEDPQQDHTQPTEISFDATKIALPFADTPRIQRNKDMRKTNAARRSSLGLRGRRASSLIDAGKSTAMPHDEVETSEFYKHIESEGLSEPRRMKQLLTWCATRALGEKPTDYSSEDGNARLAAREIQNQLLKDFSKRSELSDWFNRNESTPPPSLPKPNPKNTSNEAKIQDLEQQIARLKTERETWETLLQPPAPPPPPSSDSTPPTANHIDPTLLNSPTQLSCLETLQSSFTPDLPSSTRTRLRSIHENLEFEIDKLAQNAHSLEGYKDVAEKVADEILAVSAERLEERDRRSGGEEGGGREGVGMRDVLRGLSRVVGRGR